MATTTLDHHATPTALPKLHLQTSTWEQVAVLVGRVFFAAIFVLSSFNHFTSRAITMAASHGVPLAGLLVPASGLLALFGGLMIALGYHARWGAVLLILFLIPVTLTMHNFWAVSDPMMHQIQMGMFMKNLSMLGGAILIWHFGAGPMSLDNRA